MCVVSGDVEGRDEERKGEEGGREGGGRERETVQMLACISGLGCESYMGMYGYMYVCHGSSQQTK